MKNHVVVAGKILQTNKKFSMLKNSQKEKINNWLYTYYIQAKDSEMNPVERKDFIISNTMKNINEADIWIPEHEVVKYFYSKSIHFAKKYKKFKSLTV